MSDLTNKIEGKAKEAAGNVTGNDDQKAEGQAQSSVGDAQSKVHDATDKVGDKVADATKGDGNRS